MLRFFAPPLVMTKVPSPISSSSVSLPMSRASLQESRAQTTSLLCPSSSLSHPPPIASVQRFVFYGMGNYTMTLNALVSQHRPHATITSHTEPFPVPGFPQITLTKSDLSPPFDDPKASGPLHDFVSENIRARDNSHGMIANSFCDMDGVYADYWNDHMKPKIWSIGPLCLAKPHHHQRVPEPTYVWKWLESREGLVLYVSFGTQAEISPTQMVEIATGLEMSGMGFVWVTGSNCTPEQCGPRGNGVVVREWVDPWEVLKHERVQGFMSHCGWNSVTEGVCAGLPVLAWPLAYDQFLNAKFVVEEVGIGIRVPGTDGERGALVRREVVAEMAKELLVGRKGEVARERAKKLAGAAKAAMEDGGSSWNSLDLMVREISISSS